MRERGAGFVLGLGVGALSAALFFFLTTPPTLDEPILKVLSSFGRPLSYTQHVETRVTIGERELAIRGAYFVDHDRRSYDSLATTTLSFIDGREIGTFSIANRVIGDDIYTLVRTENGTLGSAIPSANEWMHFRRGAIPAEYIDISSDRPILDNLVLLRGEGAYLKLLKKHGLVTLNSEEFLRYTFRLSPIALEIPGGTMGAIVNRLGPSGTIDLWLAPETEELRHISLMAKDYFSTTTIRDVNTARILERPE